MIYNILYYSNKIRHFLSSNINIKRNRAQFLCPCSVMPKFFLPNDNIPYDKTPETLSITGSDAYHLARVLRAKIGEELAVSDMRGRLFKGKIISISDSEVTIGVDSVSKDDSEPTVKVTLYQALAKGDKFDTVIQKSVECGVSEIVPVICERCVVKLDAQSAQKKLARWQKIADEASKQCGRGILAKVKEPVDFCEALKLMKNDDFPFMCYEGSGVVPIKQLLSQRNASSYSFIVGPEGGFSVQECTKAAEIMPLCGLGKRILRTETASTVVLSAIMYHTDNL